ncbi:hypothetical protein SAMN05192562_104214 [Kosakonia arachidis]|uniref:Uncharacterized protein n=1 Tax=Kosakonia arachidis TaxID=551989 RepID=A0A1I7CZB6_9ENTR|nr:hypothetical protein SAMN05192562_104214 [Kosakonia arachidis]
MDIALLNRGWNRTWSDTMVNLEARKVVELKPMKNALYASKICVLKQTICLSKSAC